MLTQAAPGINKTINFQGKMTDDNGLNVTDGTYQFVFSLYTVASGGSATWTETVNLDVTDGIFHHNLGSSTALPGSVDFDTDNIFLGITFNSDPDGEMSPRIQLTASPYAFNSDQLDGLDASDFVQLSPSVAQTGDIDITGSITAASFDGDGSAITGIDAGNIATGTLAVDRGGTGAASHTAGGILFGNGTAALTNSGVLANGELLIGDGSGAPTVATLTAGSGISITNGAGSITIAATGGSGGDILQNGNSFTAAMTIGTNDAYALNFETNGTTRASFDSSGNFSVDSGTLYVDAANNRVGIGTSSPTAGFDLTIGNGVGSADVNFAPQAGGGASLIFDNGAGTYQMGYDGGANEVYLYASGGQVAVSSSGVAIDRNFTVDTNLLFASYTGDYVNIGSTSDLSARFGIVGAADEEQLLIRANATQSSSNPLILLQNSSGTEISRITANSSTNVGFGFNVLNSLSSGGDNIALGSTAADSLNTGSRNVAIGTSALTAGGNDSDNVAIGYTAAARQSAASGNVALGSGALNDNLDGNNNTVVGRNASAGSGAGSSRANNVVIGASAGLNMSSSNNNILIGYQAGDNITTGDGNLIIGYNLDASSSSAANELRIGSGTNVMLQGDLSTMAATFNGTLNVASTLTIGTSNTTGTLLVLDTKTDSGDPTGVNGGMYYNSNAGKFRCYEGGTWKDCIGAGGGGSGDILQGGNSFTAAMTIGTNDTYDLNFETDGTTRLTVQADGDVAFDTNTLFVDAANNRVGIGTATPSQPLEVQGNVMFQTPTNSVSALEIKRQDGNKIFRVDTTNSVAVFGEYNAITGHIVFESSGSTYNTSLVGQSSLAASRTIYLPDADGTICISSGNCAPSGYIFQGGNTLGAAMTIGTNDSYGLNLETGGSTRLAIDTSGNATLGGNFLPSTDDTYNLGSNTYRWADLFLGPSTLHIGTSTSDEGTISYDTTGNNMIIGATNGVVLQNGADSTTAFQILDNADDAVLTVDTTNNQVALGAGTMFVLGSATSDPSGVAGAMYYNTTDEKLRCYVGGAWTDCAGSGGGGGGGSISRTSRVEAQSSASHGTGSYNAGSTFTPAANTVLIAQVYIEVNSGGGTPAAGATDITISGGSLTWNAIGGERYVQDWDQGFRTFYAVVDGSPPSNMQVVVDAGSLSVYMYHVAVHEFTGVDETTPAEGFVSGTFSGAKSSSETLGDTPTAADWVIATVQEDSNGGGSDLNVPSGWASIFSSAYTPDVESYYRTGTTSTDVEFNVTNSYGWGPAVWSGFILRASGSGGGGGGGDILSGGNSLGQAMTIGTNDNYDLQFETNATTRMVLQADGDLAYDTDTFFVDATNNRVGIGSSTPQTALDVRGVGVFSGTLPTTGLGGSIGGAVSIGSNSSYGSINAYNHSGASALPLVLNTSGGELRFGGTTAASSLIGTSAGAAYIPSSYLIVSRSGNAAIQTNRLSSDGATMIFRRQGTIVGEISVTGTTTSFTSLSDYRLKENVVDLDNALARVMQLQPVRYNFKSDPSRTVDGFLAHQAQGVVPEAVTGVKDAVDENGNPIYQMIDQAKLVPLAVAAVRELSVRTDTHASQISLLVQKNNTQDLSILNLSNQLTSVSSTTNGLSSSVSGIQSQLSNGAFGSLNVSGTAQIQNLAVVQNLTVGDTLTVTNRIITKNLTITGHIKTAGASPTTVLGSSVSASGTTVVIDGNDSSGTVTITTGQSSVVASEAHLAEVAFTSLFESKPRVMLSPANSPAAQSRLFVDASTVTTSYFRLYSLEDLAPNTTYQLNYWIVE